MMRVLVYLSIFLCQIAFVNASGLSDSTTIVSNQPDSVTRKVVFLLLEASELSGEKPLQALKNYRKALTINKAKDVLWEANIRLAMGKLLYQVKSKDAMAQLLKADALFKKKSNLSGRAATLTEIAKIQEGNGLFETALINYTEAYRMQNKLGEAVLAGNIASHLTDVYMKKLNFAEAFKYADMAKNAYYKVCRMDSLGSIYYRIATIKLKLKSPKTAEYYILNQALPYFRSSNNLPGRLKSFDFLGQLYLDQKRYSEAKWFYLQANNQARIINDTLSIMNSLINLGVTKIYIGDLVLAKQDITEAELLSQSDSTYAPIMKKAKVKYASLFKKMNAPVIASSETKKPKIAVTKPKTATKKIKASDKPATTPDLTQKEKKESKTVAEINDQ